LLDVLTRIIIIGAFGYSLFRAGVVWVGLVFGYVFVCLYICYYITYTLFLFYVCYFNL